MEWIVRECVDAAGCPLEISAAFVGADVLVCLQGGDQPHIGCVVQTEPRESLTGNGSVSATSSVLNYPGHKDEVICRYVAEKVSGEESGELSVREDFIKIGLRLRKSGRCRDVLETVTEKIVGQLR